jgi:hypothetical protein
MVDRYLIEISISSVSNFLQSQCLVYRSVVVRLASSIGNIFISSIVFFLYYLFLIRSHPLQINSIGFNIGKKSLIERGRLRRSSLRVDIANKIS